MNLIEKLIKNVINSLFFVVYIIPVMLLDVIKSVLWSVLVYPFTGKNLEPFLLTENWVYFLDKHNDNKIIELQ